MTALSANKVRPSRNLMPTVKKYRAGVDIFYVGAIIMIDTNGYALPAAASDANKGCVGVCAAYVDNSGGSAGDLWVEVLEGEFLVTGTSLAQTATQNFVYASDDTTVDETKGTNEPLAGILTEYVSSTSAWVKIDSTSSNLQE